MRRAVLFAGLLLALLVAGCASAPQPPEGAAAERAVYEAFFAPAGGTRDEPVRVVGATDAAWFAENPMSETDWGFPWLADLGGIPIGLVEELYRVNRTAAPIAADPPLANVELLPAGYEPPDGPNYDLRCLMEEEERAKAGKGDEPDCDPQIYYTVSRVAFSSDRHQALLKYYYHCRGLCASEGFVAFEWDGGEWREIGRRLLWVS